jgi:hypothetical protein
MKVKDKKLRAKRAANQLPKKPILGEVLTVEEDFRRALVEREGRRV